MGKYTKNQSFKEMSMLLFFCFVFFVFVFLFLFVLFFFSHHLFFFSHHRGRISSVGRGLDCRAGVFAFVSRDGTNTQSLKNN